MFFTLLFGTIASVAGAETVVSAKTQASSKADKSAPKQCKNASCEERIMSAMVDIIVRARDTSASGLTYDNCAKAAPKFTALAYQLKPVTLSEFIDKNGHVGQCDFSYVARPVEIDWSRVTFTVK
ncbi:MAG: hypothetical protein KBC69_04250 [Candidatus Magasanikbacteria bacterium]|nr:hypothetical protein [Candidatus Magasanikbacteria bacterium]